MTGFIDSNFQNVNPFSEEELCDMIEVCKSVLIDYNCDDINYHSWAIRSFADRYLDAGVTPPVTLFEIKKKKDLLTKAKATLLEMRIDLESKIDTIPEQEFERLDRAYFGDEVDRLKELCELWDNLRGVYQLMIYDL